MMSDIVRDPVLRVLAAIAILFALSFVAEWMGCGGGWRNKW
jgi:hypothetical protein